MQAKSLNTVPTAAKANLNMEARLLGRPISDLPSTELTQNFGHLVESERRMTAAIIQYIHEIDSRRVYLEFGFTSLFAFLTKQFKYSPAAAQRRIDAARLLSSTPEIAANLENGSLNLSQVSLFAQAVRDRVELNCKNPEQGTVTLDHARRQDLLEKIKNADVRTTQVLLARELDIPVKQFEKKRLQQDESLRLELTLTKEQQELFQRVRDLVSHTNPNPTWAELFEIMAQDSVRLRDPAAKRGSRKTGRKNPIGKRGPDSSPASPNPAVAQDKGRPSFARTPPRQPHSTKHADQRHFVSLTKPNCRNTATEAVALARQEGRQLRLLGRTIRDHIPADLRREVFRRDQFCQWRDPKTGFLCGSRFQLQMDHVVPVAECGGNQLENLQILCGSHNRVKGAGSS